MWRGATTSRSAWWPTPACDCPADENVEQVIVASGFDAADDWIAERATEGDVVISGDIPLASRCLERGARVIDFKGQGVDPGHHRRRRGGEGTHGLPARVGPHHGRAGTVRAAGPVALPPQARRVIQAIRRRR